MQEKNEIKPSDFDRTYPPMNYYLWPVYHDALEKLNLYSRSWKIQHCGIDAIKIRCSAHSPLHDYYVPIFCNCRTCPECTLQDMRERYDQFRDISVICNDVNGNPGDIFPEHERWKVWFVTLTSKAVPGEPLGPVLDVMKESLYRWWRYCYGERTPVFDRGDIIQAWKDGKTVNHKLRLKIRGPEPEAGGLFFVEIQSGWNVHFHGLVLGPQRDFEYLQKIWKESLDFYGWSGNWIKVKEVYADPDGSYKGSIFEILNYPVRPDKSGRHDQELMAHVEKALFKKRRYVVKGSWYGKFPRNKAEPSRCPICDAKVAIWFDKDLEQYFGKSIENYFFCYDKKGVENFNAKTRAGLKNEINSNKK